MESLEFREKLLYPGITPTIHCHTCKRQGKRRAARPVSSPPAPASAAGLLLNGYVALGLGAAGGAGDAPRALCAPRDAVELWEGRPDVATSIVAVEHLCGIIHEYH